MIGKPRIDAQFASVVIGISGEIYLLLDVAIAQSPAESRRRPARRRRKGKAEIGILSPDSAGF